MFNPMTPSEMMNAVGRAASEAARGEAAASDFSRGQLMSAYSATRHLAVELAAFGAELRWFAAAAAGELRAARGLEHVHALSDRASELACGTDAQRTGDLVSEVLDAIRADGSPQAGMLRTRLHRLLRELSEREVELLADAIEGQRPA